MAQPIRLKFVVEGPDASGKSAVDQLARQLDASIGYHNQKTRSDMDRLVRDMQTQWTRLSRTGVVGVGRMFQGIDAHLTQIERRFGRFFSMVRHGFAQMNSAGGAGGGGGASGGSGRGARGGGGGGVGGASGFDAYAMLASMGMLPSGLSRTRYSSSGAATQWVQYVNSMNGQRAWLNTLSGQVRLNQNRGMADDQTRIAMQEALRREQQRDRDRMVARAREQLGGGSFRWSRYNLAGVTSRDGDPVVENYTRSAGVFRGSERASLNLETGQMTTHLNHADSAWARLSRRITGDGGPLLRTLNTLALPVRGMVSLVHAAERSWRTLGDTMIRVSAVMYAGRRIGSILNTTIGGPIRQVFAATEENRNFRMSLSGVTGGYGRASQLDEALFRQSSQSSLSLSELREAAQALGFTPALSARLGAGTPGQGAAQVDSFGKLIQRLALMDPAQGSQGAVLALRELAEGDAISLRRRFGISTRTLSRLASDATGRSVSVGDITGDPVLGFQAVERLAEMYIPESSLAQAEGLISNRMKRLREAVRFGAGQIGDSGVFDAVSDRLKGASDQVFAYFDPANPEWRQQASRLSTGLDRILKNVTSGGFKFLERLTGSAGGEQTLERFVSLIGDLVNKFGEWTDLLPGAAGSLGALAGNLTGIRDSFHDIARTARDLQQIAADPHGYAGGVLAQTPERAGNYLARRYGNVTAEGDRLDAARRMLQELGVESSVQYQDIAVSAASAARQERRASGDGWRDVASYYGQLFRNSTTGEGTPTLKIGGNLDHKSRMYAEQLAQGMLDTGGVSPELAGKLAASLRASQSGGATPLSPEMLALRAQQDQLGRVLGYEKLHAGTFGPTMQSLNTRVGRFDELESRLGRSYGQYAQTVHGNFGTAELPMYLVDPDNGGRTLQSGLRRAYQGQRRCQLPLSHRAAPEREGVTVYHHRAAAALVAPDRT